MVTLTEDSQQASNPQETISVGKIEKILNQIRGLFDSEINKRQISDHIGQFEAIVKANPLDKEKWMILGRLYSNTFNFEKAIECKTKASGISPDDPEIKFSLGCSYCAKGDTPMAIKSYLQALKLRPNYQEVYECLAEQYLILGDEQTAEIWKARAKAIKL
jgi:cytochrome c-type biogenesis protein CcmH/NrfG